MRRRADDTHPLLSDTRPPSSSESSICALPSRVQCLAPSKTTASPCVAQNIVSRPIPPITNPTPSLLRTRLWSASLAFLDKTNVIVTALTALVLLLTRSAGVAYFCTGSTLCSITVKILKRVLKQSRPQYPLSHRPKTSYGMPSTHSATISFYATYLTLSSAYLPLHPPSFLHLSVTTRVIPPALALPWATLVILSRVWLGHHTWPQVAVGMSYGISLAVLWFLMWTHGLDRFGPLLERALHP